MSAGKTDKKSKIALLNAIASSEFLEYIDKGKLAKSQIIRDIAEYSVSHAVEHGDRNYIFRILQIFEKSRYYSPVLLWLCDAAGLKTKVHQGKVKLYRSKKTPGALGDIQSHIDNNSGSLRKLLAETPKIPKTRKADHFIDLLDSPSRLPGCYGAGKRR